MQKDFNISLNNLINEIRNNKSNKFLLNSEERKILFNMDTNINKLANSVLPILVLSENQNLINLMGKYIDEIKAEEENQQNESIKANLNMKKQFIGNDYSELRKCELIEALIDGENSDFKIQEMFRKKIEKLLRKKLSKD